MSGGLAFASQGGEGIGFEDRLQARLLYLQRAPRKAVAGCRGLGRYFFAFGGLIMMCAPAVPGYISHGAPGLGESDSPVVAGVAKG